MEYEELFEEAIKRVRDKIGEDPIEIITGGYYYEHGLSELGVKNGDFAQHSASTTGDFVFLTDNGHKSSKAKEIYIYVC